MQIFFVVMEIPSRLIDQRLQLKPNAAVERFIIDDENSRYGVQK
jgi:hypothetical protein